MVKKGQIWFDFLKVSEGENESEMAFIKGSVVYLRECTLKCVWPLQCSKMSIFCLNPALLFTLSVTVRSRSHLVVLLLKALLNCVPSVISAERTAESDAAAVMESPREPR